MRYGSICSGIEAATVAWETLGWTPAFFSEIDPFCSSLLNQRYPGVPNYGDFTQLLDPAHPVHSQPPIDVLVGGTPCQDFSVAGLRAGVAGARGGLTLDFCRLVDVLRPRWVVWENVPGVLSSDGGRALGAFTGALAELGYGFAWRVLDAQYFGLAQRRKRVFVVGHAGGQPGRPGAVLLEPEGVRGDPPSRKQARKEAPADAGGRAACGGERSSLAITERGRGDGLSLEHQDEVAYALTSPGELGGSTSYSIRADAMREGVAKTPSADAEGRVRLRDPGMGLYENVAPTLDCGQAHGVLVPIDLRQTARGEKNTNNRHNSSGGSPGTGIGADGDPAFTVSERGQAVMVFDYKQSGGDGYLEETVITQADVAGKLDSNYFKGQGSRQGGEREYVATFSPEVAGTLGGNAGQLTGDRDDPGVTVQEEIHPPLCANPMSDRAPFVGVPHTTDKVQSIAFYPNMGQKARTDGASIELATTISGANGGNKQSVATFSPEVAGTLGASPQSGGFRTTDLDNSGAFIAYRKSRRASSNEDSETWIPADVSNTINIFDSGDVRTTHVVVEPCEQGQAVAVSFNQRCEARTSRGQLEPICPTLNGADAGATSDMRPCVDIFTGEGGVAPAVAFNGHQRTEGSVTWPLGACDGRKVEVGVRQGFSVRRLTPRECERLQGFPDDYTLVPYRKGLSADGHRYKALGNSMAVPVMRWIGARIALVEALDEVAEGATAPEPIPSTVGAGRKWRHPNADLTIQNDNNPTQPKPSRKWSRNP